MSHVSVAQLIRDVSITHPYPTEGHDSQSGGETRLYLECGHVLRIGGMSPNPYRVHPGATAYCDDCSKLCVRFLEARRRSWTVEALLGALAPPKEAAT